MKFLDLVKRVYSLSGISGDAPITTVAQKGEFGRLVDWTADAGEEIERAHTDWKFLQHDFTVNTVTDQRAYLITACTDNVAVAAMTVAKFSQWKLDSFRIYLQSAGVATQRVLYFLGYDTFRYLYMKGTELSGSPAYFTIRPHDSAILLGQKPNDVYVVTGEFWVGASRMSADADVPAMPARFHMAIVHRALMYYASFEEAMGKYVAHKLEFDKINGTLEIDQLPAIELAPPLVS